MSLDVKYRPSRFEDVLGQDVTIKILKSIVGKDRGFEQSYLLSGSHGCGKTTLGRILAKTLLCDHLVEGEPCNKCSSCVSISKGMNTECFTEIDAATNSGKENIMSILEELDYATSTGKQRIWLFDESHRLTRDALDALLKPMEDCVTGTNNRKLVCIFCTTEPEKMRSTIASRCLNLQVKHSTHEQIVDRLETICQNEGINYERSALNKIRLLSGMHIRDSIKLLELVSYLGEVNDSNLSEYKNTDNLDLFSNLILNLGVSTRNLQETLNKINSNFSPMESYKNIARLSLCSFRFGYDLIKEPTLWSNESLKEIFDQHGDRLIMISKEFTSSPKYPKSNQFAIDVLLLHKRCTLESDVMSGKSSEPIRIPSNGILSNAEFSSHLKSYVNYLSDSENKYG